MQRCLVGCDFAIKLNVDTAVHCCIGLAVVLATAWPFLSFFSRFIYAGILRYLVSPLSLLRRIESSVWVAMQSHH